MSKLSISLEAITKRVAALQAKLDKAKAEEAAIKARIAAGETGEAFTPEVGRFYDFTIGRAETKRTIIGGKLLAITQVTDAAGKNRSIAKFTTGSGADLEVYTCPVTAIIPPQELVEGAPATTNPTEQALLEEAAATSDPLATTEVGAKAAFFG